MSQSQSEEIYDDVRELLSQLDNVHDQMRDYKWDHFYVQGPISFALLERLREAVD